MKEIKDVLTKGLLAGFAGGKPKEVVRGNFTGKVSEPDLDDGIYHDEWFTGFRSGGGQELVSIGENKFTRLYAGGTVKKGILEKLGTSEGEVGSYLVGKINELGDRTRLFEDCIPEVDGDFQYSYRITSRDEEIGVTTGVEKINYKDTTVFIHAFILSPIV